MQLPLDDGQNRILKHIDNNSNKLDLQCKYYVSTSFNIGDLFSFHGGHDLKTNPF